MREIQPHSKLELEADILELLCLWSKKNVQMTETNICNHFGIAKKTLTASLKQMLEKGYIEPYQKNEEIQLTPYGISEGNEYLYRHHSISQFLQFIGVEEKIADQDACRAEHIFTDETIQALCTFVNSDNKHYERRIRNSELTDRYEPGTYEFMMQVYSMEQARPRKLKEENSHYTGNIFLEITDEEGWFELEYENEPFGKKLWYKNTFDITGEEWTQAKRGKKGERIPANAFEFIIKANEVIVEGHLLVAFTEENETPNMWNSCQLEVEIW